MVFFLSETRLKNDLLHDNVSGEYIRPAMITGQTVYLKEALGDSLYSRIEALVSDGTVPQPYKALLDDYIIPYLEFLVMAEITMNVSFKVRNLGVVTTNDVNATQTTMENTKYFQNYYQSKAEFYENRLRKYLTLHAEDYPEYKVCGCDGQITNPKGSTYGGLYLGGDNVTVHNYVKDDRIHSSKH